MKILFFFRNAEWLGIEYLSSMLISKGHHTDLIFDPGAGDVEMSLKILDTKDRFGQNVIRKLKEFEPDLICFSALTNLYPWVRKYASFVKQILPKTPILVGGLHPTMFPEVVLKDNNIDMVCIGEGEDAIVELVESLKNGNKAHSVNNIWYKRDGEIISNPLRELRQDLDGLPFPDKDLFYKYGCFSDRIYVMTGRGCPYQCTYCFNHTYKDLYSDKGKYIRKRSVDNCIEELHYFTKRYNVREVFFYDDTFTLNKAWVQQFCERYRSEIGLPFAANIRANTVSRSMMEVMKESGCVYVVMGVESGNEFVRNKLLKRGMSNETLISAAETIHSIGLKLCTLNIVGTPTETVDQMWETVSFNRRLRPNGGSMTSVFYPFPKTELYTLACETGLLDEEKRKMVDLGIGSYRESTILNHPEKKVIDRVMTFEPIMVRLPSFLHPLFKKLPPLKIFRVISVFFFSPVRHLKFRLKELLLMRYYFIKG